MSMTPEELNERNKKTLRAAELRQLNAVSFKELEAAVDRWLLMPDRGLIKLICAMIVTNRSDRKPVWLALIAPSGGGKTAVLDGLLKIPDVYEVSTVTPQTFLSGMPGKNDPSLLPRLNGKVMVMKDFTSILSMQKDARADILGQFREIWDGHMTKEFGNGQKRDWTGKVTLLVASTQAFDLNQQQTTHLGERFLNYRPLMPGRKEVTRIALKNDHRHEEMLHDLQNAFFGWYKGLDWDQMKQTENLLPESVKEEIIDLSDFATMARSGVIREYGPQKTIVFVPAAEMPPRMAIQLSSLASGLIGVNQGKFNEEDMKIVYKVAIDSIPSTNWMVIREMAKGDNRTTAQIATSVGYPTPPIRMYLENLAVLKVARRVKAKEISKYEQQGEGTADRWTLKKAFREIVLKYEDVGDLSEEEVEAIDAENEANRIFNEGLAPETPDDLDWSPPEPENM